MSEYIMGSLEIYWLIYVFIFYFSNNYGDPQLSLLKNYAITPVIRENKSMRPKPIILQD